MAVRKESKERRGCGFRKAGGLYLVGPPFGSVCDRLVFKLVPCDICGKKHEHNRGLSRVTGKEVFHYSHDVDLKTEAAARGEEPPGFSSLCECNDECPACNPQTETAGLMWVGRQHYPKYQDFCEEAVKLGVSKRVANIPSWFKVGETWVFLAHIECAPHTVPASTESLMPEETILVSGVFRAFVPQRIEKVMNESEAAELTDEEVQELEDQGVEVVTVPDSDPDHH